MIVFDAGVLIAHFDRRDSFHDVSTAFMEEHEEFEYAANVVTISECLVHPALAGDLARAVDEMDKLRLVQVEVTADDIVPLAELRASSRLRMPDALVVHTAERLGGELVTTDRALARAAAERGIIAHAL